MKKGFTLIELLAVIVILALIALVTIPMINNVIEKAKKGALEDSVYGLKSAAELYYSTTGTSETIEFTCTTEEGCINGDKKLPFKGSVEDGKVKLFSDGKVSICLTEDGYGSSILAGEKKVTTKMGGCDEETYKVSEVIAIEKYDEVKEELDKVKNEFLSVKTTLNNKAIITKVDNEAEEINKEINSYGDGINNLVDSLYGKEVISTKENTFEEMSNEINNLDLNQGEAENKKIIVESLKNSDLGITEDMEWEEIANVFNKLYPSNIDLIADTVSSDWSSTPAEKTTTLIKIAKGSIYYKKPIIITNALKYLYVAGSHNRSNTGTVYVDVTVDLSNWTTIYTGSLTSQSSFSTTINMSSYLGKSVYIRIRYDNGSSSTYYASFTKLKLSS